MTSRLEIINSALVVGCKCEPCTIEFDGSPEWTVAYAAYTRYVPLLLAKGYFNFTTSTAVLSRLGDAPAEIVGGWENAYAMPAGALHLRSVVSGGSPVPYQILDNKILTREDGVTALFVREPDQSSWPPLFVEALTQMIEAGIQRGLLEDYKEAERREASAWAMFDTAATKSDQQGTGRAVYASRIRARRRGSFYNRGL